MSSKNEALEKAIRDGGFYNKDGIWNSIKKIPGDDHIYRVRVETIVVKNDKEVFMKVKPNKEYRLPGGSTEKDVSDEQQAINECHEEAHLNIRNVKYSGITYKEYREQKWIKEKNLPVTWNGCITKIFVADYDSKFKGKVDPRDKDSFILSGRWYPLVEAFKLFRKEHKEALLQFLKEKESLKKESEDLYTETYITNYFANKKLLKKINANPEVNRDAILQIIDILKKDYGKLSATSRIRKERQQDDVGQIFHPILTFEFYDKQVITIALCFDDSSQTPGAATYTEKYGDICIIYPSFFKYNKEGQIYILLHEFGHIRLKHLQNPLLFGDDIEHRKRVMRHGSVVYPEVNADLYAVLNGAKMYAILDGLPKKDYDKKYDYRFTASEFANRYAKVFRQYTRLNPDMLGESGGDIMQDNLLRFTPIDVARCAVYELCYDNIYTENLSDEDKRTLHQILYEVGVNNRRDEIMNEATCITEYNAVEDFTHLKKLYKDDIVESVTSAYNEATLDTLVNYEFDKDLLNSAYLIESLTKKERDKIPGEQFGLPKERKFPLDSKKHVLSAINLFGHCEESKRKELAHNILGAMDSYGMSRDIIGPKSKINNYI